LANGAVDIWIQKKEKPFCLKQNGRKILPLP